MVETSKGILMTEKKEKHQDCIIIEGITHEGLRFRPSDWVDRFSGKLASFTSRRTIQYSPLLRPIICNGAKCILIDKKLETVDAKLYKSILFFAKQNNLRMHSKPPT